MPTKIDGQTDWNKFFMGIAVAVVFVFQAYTTTMQQVHDNQLHTLEDTTLSEVEIDEKIDMKTNHLIMKLIDIQKETLKLDREWMEWQKRNTKARDDVSKSIDKLRPRLGGE